VAELCWHKAHYAAQQIAELPGFEVKSDGPFFHEFVVKTPVPPATINDKLRAKGIIGGYDLLNVGSAFDHHLLVCTTELNDRAGIDVLVNALRS